MNDDNLGCNVLIAFCNGTAKDAVYGLAIAALATDNISKQKVFKADTISSAFAAGCSDRKGIAGGRHFPLRYWAVYI